MKSFALVFLAVSLLTTAALPGFGQGASLPFVKAQWSDSNGLPVALGRICTYADGTSTPQATYSDAALTVANTNPIQLDAAGRPPTAVFLSGVRYKIVMHSFSVGSPNTCPYAGTVLWTQSNVAVVAQFFEGTNLDNIRLCDKFAGANAGAKIVAAIAALPSTGGTVDCRGLEDAQTIAQNIFSGVTKCVTLLLGNATFTSTVTWTPSSCVRITGQWGQTHITVGNGIVLIQKPSNTTALNFVELSGLTVSLGTGSGFLRVGDRSAAYNGNGFNLWWRLQDIYVDALSGTGVPIDLTQMANMVTDHVYLLNCAVCMELTTITQSAFHNTVINGISSATGGLYIHNDQSGAVQGQMDGTTFTSTTIEGLANGAVGLNLVNVGGGQFERLFFERSSGTAVSMIRMRTSFLNKFVGGTFSLASGSVTNIVDIQDSFGVTFTGFATSDLGETAEPFNISYSPQALASYVNRGGVSFIDCSYSINKMVASNPWVTVRGSDKYPGGTSQSYSPTTGVTDMWARSLANRQGARVAESDLVLDAFHGQNRYDSANVGTVVSDSATSSGFAVQVTANNSFGFEFNYPGQITAGAYELVIRGRSTSGTPAGAVIVTSVGVGTLVNEATANWSTTYKTYSIRFRLTTAAISTGTAIRASVAVAGIYNIDYMVLRPAFNDFLCQPYVAPDDQQQDTTGGVSNGGRISCSAAIPTTGNYSKGDFVYNLTNSATAPITVGWSRLTSGTGHVVGTDWAVLTTPKSTLTGTASLDFAAWAGNDCQTLTITVTGAADGDVVRAGMPNGDAGVADVVFGNPWVSAADTVSVRGCKVTAGASGNPTAFTFRAIVEKY